MFKSAAVVRTLCCSWGSDSNTSSSYQTTVPLEKHLPVVIKKLKELLHEQENFFRYTGYIEAVACAIDLGIMYKEGHFEDLNAHQVSSDSSDAHLDYTNIQRQTRLELAMISAIFLTILLEMLERCFMRKQSFRYTDTGYKVLSFIEGFIAMANLAIGFKNLSNDQDFCHYCDPSEENFWVSVKNWFGVGTYALVAGVFMYGFLLKSFTAWMRESMTVGGDANGRVNPTYATNINDWLFASKSDVKLSREIEPLMRQVCTAGPEQKSLHELLTNRNAWIDNQSAEERKAFIKSPVLSEDESMPTTYGNVKILLKALQQYEHEYNNSEIRPLQGDRPASGYGPTPDASDDSEPSCLEKYCFKV